MKQKSIKKNLIYNLIYQMLTIILPLITTPYVARVIGPEGTGIYSYTYSIANYFVIFGMLGISNYGNRLIAQNRENSEKLSAEFSSLYTLHLSISALTFIMYILFSILLASDYKIFFMIQCFYVLSSLFDINWLFWGLEEFKTTILRNIVIRITSLICIFLFVKTKQDVYLYSIILSGGTLLSQLALFPFLKKFNIKYKKPRFSEMKKHIKPLMILFVPVIAVSVYKVMDKIMIGSIINVTEVGLYEYAERIISMPMALITALGTVMLPRMSNLAAKGNDEQMKRYITKSMNFILLFSMPLAFGMVAVSKDFVPLFLGDKYIGSIILVQLLSITIPIVSFANVIRTQYLIPKSMDKEYVTSLILGAIFNFVLNYFLIIKYNAMGACIATIVAESIVMIYQTIKVYRKINVIDYIKYFIKYLGAAAMMLFIIYLFNLIEFSNVIVKLILDILIGASIYLLINYKEIKKFMNLKIIKDIK